MKLPLLQVLILKGVSIFDQLKLEEALLRVGHENFFLINEESSPAIVLGISGQIEKLVDLTKAKQENVPLIRRFSGGGTVIVDHNTIFTTFIMNNSAIHISNYPEPIMRWTGNIFEEAFQIPGFTLRENDYVIHDKKCGGNAQYLQKNRWLHHTTFLWDYEERLMSCLLHPLKTPLYRENRIHSDFLSKLKNHTTSKENLKKTILNTLQKYFTIQFTCLENVNPLTLQTHRSSTQVLSNFF